MRFYLCYLSVMPITKGERFQSRLLREREQAPRSDSAVSIGPLPKTPYLLSSPDK